MRYRSSGPGPSPRLGGHVRVVITVPELAIAIVDPWLSVLRKAVWCSTGHIMTVCGDGVTARGILITVSIHLYSRVLPVLPFRYIYLASLTFF